MSGVIHIAIAYAFAVLLYALWVREARLRRRTERECQRRVERAEADAIYGRRAA
jgi:hypothetical protein